MPLRRILVAVMAAAGSSLLPAVPAVAAAPLVTTERAEISFSPNGDGRRDVARVPFMVERDGTRIWVVVRRQFATQVLGPLDLGPLQRGVHSWRWDGHSASGGTLPDGRYSVVFRAARAGTTDRARASVVVDRAADDGRLVATRTTIYPRAALVHDSVRVAYLRQGWWRWEAEFPDSGPFDARPPLRARMAVLDDDGQRVWRRRWDGEGFTPEFDFDARRSGSPLAAGSYTARVRVVDPAGNLTIRTLPVTVSAAQLVEQLWSTTVAAASADRFYVLFPPGCNGCGEGCSPVPSQRFAGGLSFPDCPGYGYDAPTYEWFAVRPDIVAAPVDSYRVSMTGGPTTPGGADIGRLDGQDVGPGDVTVAGEWRPLDLHNFPFLPNRSTVLSWVFSTWELNSYDVATFTVEYRYYVPAT